MFDTVLAKVISINDEFTNYTVNINGQIFNFKTGKYLKPFKNPRGYCLVDLHVDGVGYTKQVHRLVAEVFIPNTYNLPTVNHIDGNKENNTVGNLEWMSIKDNVRHAWNTGLAKARFGIDNPANVYSEKQVHDVCRLLELRKYTNVGISKLCNVKVSLVKDIKSKGKWKHISEKYDIPH